MTRSPIFNSSRDLPIPRLAPSRFVAAVAVAVALVLAAPYIGQVRSMLRTAFPHQFAAIVAGLVAALVLASMLVGLARIKQWRGQRRALRYLALGLSLFVATAFAWWHRTGRADVDAVEAFHFVEYGVITWLFYRAWKPVGDASIFILPFFASMIVGTCDEGLQWFVPARVGEMNDVILNGVAIACGVMFSVGVDPPGQLVRPLLPGSLRRIGTLAAAFGLTLAVFVHVVHLGYLVQDGDIGSFTSRYSRQALEDLDRDKREEWRVRPLPQTLRRVSREDQYMTEGVVHVQKRNEQWAAGNMRAAWQENRILEKYFDAVLDAPSYVSLTGHRWPAGQRADAAARVAADAGFTSAAAAAYVSDAYPYPIYTWWKRRFWMWVLPIVAGLFLISVVIEKMM